MWCVVPLIADKKEGGVLPTSTQQPVPSTPHNASIEIEEPWTAADAMLLWRSDIIHVIQNSIVLILSSIFIKHHQHPQTSIGVYQLIFMRLSLSTFEFEVLFIACMKNIVTCLPSQIFTFFHGSTHIQKRKSVVMCHVDDVEWCWTIGIGTVYDQYHCHLVCMLSPVHCLIGVSVSILMQWGPVVKSW